MVNKLLRYLKKVSLLDSKITKGKLNHHCVLVLEDNGKKNPDESYGNKYQKHIASSYAYKLICVDDKFSKPFKSYLGVKMLFIILLMFGMIKESKYCNDMMKDHFNKDWLKKLMEVLSPLNVGFLIIIMLIVMLI